MVNIIQPASLWSQLSNLFFLLSGIFNDLLVLRVFLTCAYIFLLIQGALGFPSWNESFSPWSGNIGLDVIVWSVINVLLNGSGVIRCYWDERKIDLSSEEEALWRYIYRHSGLSKAQFEGLLCPTLKMMTFEKGQPIPTHDMFYIVLDGIIGAEVAHMASGVRREIRLFSGEMFPLEHLYIDYMPQESVFSRSRIKPVAATNVRLYAIPTATLKSLAMNPDARDAWMAMLIASLAEIAERPYTRNSSMEILTDAKLTDSVLGAEINPLFKPLHPSEEPDPLLAGSSKALSRPLAHLCKYIKLSVYVPWPLGAWPIGLRQALRPPVDPNTNELRKRLSVWETRGLSLRDLESNNNIEVDRLVPESTILDIAKKEQSEGQRMGSANSNQNVEMTSRMTSATVSAFSSEEA